MIRPSTFIHFLPTHPLAASAKKSNANKKRYVRAIITLAEKLHERHGNRLNNIQA